MKVKNKTCYDNNTMLKYVYFTVQIQHTSNAEKQLCGALLHCPQSHQEMLAKSVLLTCNS